MDELEDEITVVNVRISEISVAPEGRPTAKLPDPPALPFPLAHIRASADAWLEGLPEPARRVLEQARCAPPNWPLAPRVDGAVAVPRDKIPHLRRRF